MTAQLQVLAIVPFLLEGVLEFFLKSCCQEQTQAFLFNWF